MKQQSGGSPLVAASELALRQLHLRPAARDGAAGRPQIRAPPAAVAVLGRQGFAVRSGSLAQRSQLPAFERETPRRARRRRRGADAAEAPTPPKRIQHERESSRDAAAARFEPRSSTQAAGDAREGRVGRMVNVPKERKTYCKNKKCRKHQVHKVTQYKAGKASNFAQGKRRYDSEADGLRRPDEARLPQEGEDDEEDRAAARVQDVQGQEAAQDQAVQALRARREEEGDGPRLPSTWEFVNSVLGVASMASGRPHDAVAPRGRVPVVSHPPPGAASALVLREHDVVRPLHHDRFHAQEPGRLVDRLSIHNAVRVRAQD